MALDQGAQPRNIPELRRLGRCRIDFYRAGVIIDLPGAHQGASLPQFRQLAISSGFD